MAAASAEPAKPQTLTREDLERLFEELVASLRKNDEENLRLNERRGIFGIHSSVA